MPIRNGIVMGKQHLFNNSINFIYFIPQLCILTFIYLIHRTSFYRKTRMGIRRGFLGCYRHFQVRPRVIGWCSVRSTARTRHIIQAGRWVWSFRKCKGCQWGVHARKWWSNGEKCPSWRYPRINKHRLLYQR